MREILHRLGHADLESVRSLLAPAPLIHHFLLHTSQEDQLASGSWLGIEKKAELRALLYLQPERLAVPGGGGIAEARLMGEGLLQLGLKPCPVLARREIGGALWRAWVGDQPPRRCLERRLYEISHPPQGQGMKGLRQAQVSELDPIAEAAEAVQGSDPLGYPSALLKALVHTQILDGDVWVVEQGGEILFQAFAGPATAWARQLTHIWVAPDQRGQHIGRRSLRSLCRRLLEQHRALLLHVNTDHLAAKRAYEAAGMKAGVRLCLLLGR